jgi:1-acyl-sn-glycerol-3-phosphate acyltransferase
MRRVHIRRSNFFYKFIRGIGYPCFHAVYGIRIQGRENLPREGPGILVPKHQFWTDIPIVALAAWRPVSYIAKHELFVYPGVRHFLSSLGGIPLDRGNPVRTLGSFREMERLMKEREFIVLFAEGTYYPNTMGRGKHRLIERILRFQERMGWEENRPIPFVPIGIRYREETPRTEVKVKIGPPLFSREGSEAEGFTQQILDEVAKLSGLASAVNRQA